MSAQLIRRMAVIVVMALLPDVTFAAQGRPGWVTKTGAGSMVQVTMKSGESFEAIWMGRDGDRAVFERLNPDEAISVPIDTVHRVRTLRGRASTNASRYASLGVGVGFWGTVLVLAMLVPRN
jgi:hypothetical protein